jgi:hypothetical protein
MGLVPKFSIFHGLSYETCLEKIGRGPKFKLHFLSARKADLKKAFQHLVVVVVSTGVKKRFLVAKSDSV